MIPESHHGAWAGPNRLWLAPPEVERCDGRIVARATELTYEWSYRGAPHTGRLAWFGPPGALRAEFVDSWHASQGMAFAGFARDGVLSLFGTYPAGEGPEWGWRIEVDWRDPEHLQLRMFNLLPTGEEGIAVDLRGARE